MKVIVIVVTLFCAVACGRQPVTPNDGPPSSSDGAVANNCPYPQGTCDWDSDCPDGQRCVGAMHTTGVPHAFVCRGICEPKPGTKTMPCDPTLDYQPSATLARVGDKIIARVTNGGCKPLYRVQGCCAEGDPVIEHPVSGGWLPTCASSSGICCDAEPTCEPLLPGQSFEQRVLPLEHANCCGTVFRVTYFFSRNPSCIDDAMHPIPTAQSPAVTLWAEDRCDGPIPAP